MSKNTDEHQQVISKLEELENTKKIIEQQVLKQQQAEKKLQTLADSLSLLVDEEDKLKTQFKKNILAFEQYFPNIAEHFKEYKTDHFDVVIHEGFANVVDNKTNSLMYDYPAYLMALEQVNGYQNKPQATHSSFHLHDEKLGSFLHSDKLNDIINIYTERFEENKNAVSEGKSNTLHKHLCAMVIFGVGLGYHLELLSKVNTFGSVYLIEPELDIFYASLYTANWPQILDSIDKKGGNIHLSLGSQESGFFDDLLTETYINGRYEAAKTHGYIHYRTPEISTLVKEYKDRYFEMIQGWGFFDDGIMAMSHFLQSVKNGVPIMKKNVDFNLDIATAPVFIIGNGPSLDQSIEFIRQHKENAIIISCGSALSALYKYGIEVDFHCEQERIFAVAEKLDFYAPKEYIEKQTLLAVSTVHPEVYKKFSRALMSPKGSEPSTELLLQDEQGKKLFESALFISPTVANTALVMAVQMGFKQFYFVGIDLGHKEHGTHHSQQSFYYDETGEDIELYPKISTQFKCEGNFGGEFTADPIFNMSRIMLEKVIERHDSCKFFNLSDGAKVKGCKAMRPEGVNFSTIINKTAIVDKALELSSYKDDGELIQRLEAAAGLEEFKNVCLALVDALDMPLTEIKEGEKLLRTQTFTLRENLTDSTMHFSSLLNGSMLHMQAMLLQLLYIGNDEKIALDDFKKGLKFYREFLIEAPDLYKNGYNKPLYNQTSHLDALKN